MRRPPGGDDGNALVEFVYLAFVVMVPLVYVMIAVFDVQRTSFGVTEAARQAGRTWAATCDAGQARAAAALALRDQGATARTVLVPDSCPQPGQGDTVLVTSFVQLRGVGALLPVGRGGITVTGSFFAVRDRFAP